VDRGKEDVMGRWWVGLLFAGMAWGQQTVPFVGCKSDGQVGPQDVPVHGPVRVTLPEASAKRLAYYQGVSEIGVLGPRGWNCFSVYGSGGDTLLVAPPPFDGEKWFRAEEKDFPGPVIEMALRFGGTSGRFQAAEIISRVFPAYSSFVRNVREMFDLPATEFPTGAFPADKLTYQSQSAVEYTTPAQADGLGTIGLLRKNDSAIQGAAVLVQPDYDAYVLAVRLPRDLEGHAAEIVGRFERDIPLSKVRSRRMGQ
jgi:hypothetical protein